MRKMRNPLKKEFSIKRLIQLTGELLKGREHGFISEQLPDKQIKGQNIRNSFAFRICLKNKIARKCTTVKIHHLKIQCLQHHLAHISCHRHQHDISFTLQLDNLGALATFHLKEMTILLSPCLSDESLCPLTELIYHHFYRVFYLGFIKTSFNFIWCFSFFINQPVLIYRVYGLA